MRSVTINMHSLEHFFGKVDAGPGSGEVSPTTTAIQASALEAAACMPAKTVAELRSNIRHWARVLRLKDDE
jgi:hypothetical protein